MMIFFLLLNMVIVIFMALFWRSDTVINFFIKSGLVVLAVLNVLSLLEITGRLR